MKTLFISGYIFLSLLLYSPTFAQNEFNLIGKWDYKRPFKIHEKINKLIATSNGYIIAVGETIGTSLRDVDGLFLVIEVENGNEILRKAFGGPGNESFNSGIQNHDGTFTLVGYSQAERNGEKQGWVVRLDMEGNMVSDNKPAGSLTRDNEIKDIAISRDGSVLAVGSQSDKKESDLWILTIDQDNFGDRVVAGGELGLVEEVVPAADGGFVIIGNTAPNDRAHPADAWVLKVNKGGQDLWDGVKYFGDRGIQEGLGITSTLDGGFAFVGVNNSGGSGLSDHWLVKLNKDGGTEWQRTIGRAYEDTANEVIELAEGGYAIFGQTKSYMPGARTTMLELLLTDERGNLIESEIYPIAANGNEIAHSLVELYNGDLVLAGNSISEKSEESTIYIGTYTYKNWVRRPNSASPPDNEPVNNTNTPFTLPRPQFFDENKNGFIEPGERGYISLLVTNQSSQKIDNVSASASLEDPSPVLEFWDNIKLGTIRPGQTKQLNIPVMAKGSLSKGAYNFFIRIEAEGTAPTGTIASVRSDEPAPARLEIAQHNFKPASGTQPGQSISLEIELINRGELASATLMADFTLPAGVQSVGPERIPIPSMRPQEKRLLIFSFSYFPNYREKSIPVIFEVEQQGMDPIRRSFQLPLDQAPPPTPQGPDVAIRSTDEIFWASHDVQSSNEVNEREIEIRSIALSSRKLQKENFYMLVNGKKNRGQKMDESDLKPPSNASGRNQYSYRDRIRLGPGENKVQCVYDNGDGTDFRSPLLTITYLPQENPNLYVLSIGVEHENLDYTVKDAVDIANIFGKLQDEKGRGFRKVDVRKLTTQKETTQRNIRFALTDLSRQGVKGNDLVVVFISSHGKIGKDGNYILIPSDYDPYYEDETSLDFKNHILDELRVLDSKTLVLIDACHSGSALRGSRSFSDPAASKMMNDLIRASSGLEIIASCDDEESSWEDEAWSNGAFTKAILEALRDATVEVDGKMIHADIYHEIEERKAGRDGVITIEELRKFISQRVPYLVKNKKNQEQHPSQNTNYRLPEYLPIYMVTNDQ